MARPWHVWRFHCASIDPPWAHHVHLLDPESTHHGRHMHAGTMEGNVEPSWLVHGGSVAPLRRVHGTSGASVVLPSTVHGPSMEHPWRKGPLSLHGPLMEGPWRVNEGFMTRLYVPPDNNNYGKTPDRWC